jgi:hypothetical protein
MSAAATESPEEAALAGWPDASGVRVVSTSVVENRAEVVLDTDPDYRYWVYCVKRHGRWHESVSGNAATEGWEDPTILDWGDQPRP